MVEQSQAKIRSKWGFEEGKEGAFVNDVRCKLLEINELWKCFKKALQKVEASFSHRSRYSQRVKKMVLLENSSQFVKYKKKEY